jgi:hypothetical protein
MRFGWFALLLLISPSVAWSAPAGSGTVEPPSRSRPPTVVEEDGDGAGTHEMIVIQMKPDVHWVRFHLYGQPNWFELWADADHVVRAKLIDPKGDYIRGYLSNTRTPFNAQLFAPLDPGFAETLKSALTPLLDGHGVPSLPDGWDPYTWIFLDFGKPFIAWGSVDGLEIDPEKNAVSRFEEETKSLASDTLDGILVLGMSASIAALEYWKYGVENPRTATACVVSAAATFAATAICKPFFYHRPLLVRYAARHPEWQWLRTKPHLNTVIFGTAMAAAVEVVRGCVRLLSGI